MTSKQSSAGAQKRILWEVRKRYNIQPMKPALSSNKHKQTAPHAEPTLASGKTGAVPSTSQQVARPEARPQQRGGRPPTYPPASSRRGAEKPSPRKKKHWLRRGIIFLVLLAVISVGIFGYKILAASNRITTSDRSILGQLTDLLFSDGKFLDGETDGRINILLLAVGGEGHQGENLADTIMVASLAPKNNQVALLSIPRDLYVQVPGEDYFTKINAVHAYGESKKKGQGPETLEKTVTEITGLPLHYYARVDFTAFKQIIDAVGGVDIAIENSFFDYWHKIDFRAGSEHMDGERSLAFVRARYVEGPEGGDFRRAARQQQVLLALRENIFSVNTALDFSALSSILDSVSANVRTDLQLWEMKRMYELARTINHNAVGSAVLSTGPRGVLVGTTEMLGGTPASVLRPRIGVGNYSEIRAIAAELLTSTNTTVSLATSQEENPPPKAEPEPTAETKPTPKPTIEIRNGTTVTGLAARTQEDLEADEYTVTAIGNAAKRDYTETTVYALTGETTDAAKKIADSLQAKTDSGLPKDEAASEAAVLVILGSDAQ